MKQLKTLLIAGLFSFSLPFAVSAEDVDFELDVVEAEETESEVVNRLSLPEGASDQAIERSQFGLDTANEARERGREFGQERALDARERANDAREKGQEAGAAARESAQQARETGESARDNRGPL